MRGRANESEVTRQVLSRRKLIFDIILQTRWTSFHVSASSAQRTMARNPQDSPHFSVLQITSTQSPFPILFFFPPLPFLTPSHLLPPACLAGSCSVPGALWVCPSTLWWEGPLVPRFIYCSPASKSAVRHLQTFIQSHSYSH